MKQKVVILIYKFNPLYKVYTSKYLDILFLNILLCFQSSFSLLTRILPLSMELIQYAY